MPKLHFEINRKQLIIAGLIILLVGILIGIFLYITNNNQPNTIPIAELNYAPITFDEIASSEERTVVTDQFKDSHGISFSGTGGSSCSPRLCKVNGSTGCGFNYQGGNDSKEIPDGAAPVKAPGRQWTPNFLALNKGCSLVIDFSQDSTKFSFDILDIDTAGGDNEAWKVQTFKDGVKVGNDIAVNKAYVNNIYPNCRECGDGRSTPVNIDLNGQLIDQIKVIPQGSDTSFGLGFDNFTPFSIPSQPSPLTIDKTSSVAVSGNTGTISYSLAVNNPNSTSANNVVIVDNLPSQVTGVTEISNNGIYNATAKTITWNIGTMSSGATQTVTFKATVSVPDNTTLEVTNEGIVYIDANQDTVTAEDEMQDSDSTIDSLTGPIPETGSLNITKTSTNASSQDNLSKVITYKLSIASTYLSSKTVNVKDTLDTKVQASWVTEISNSGSLSEGIITWSNLSIPASGNLDITYKVTIPNASTGTYTNVAVLYNADNTEIDRDDETITINAAQEVGALNITKTSTSATLGSSQAVTYTLTVQNTFPTEKSGLKIIDTLDSKVQDSWVSNISNNGVLNNRVITWTSLTIAAGQSLSITYKVTIPVSTGGNYTNVAVLYDSNNTEVDRDTRTITIATPVSTPLPTTGILDDNRSILILAFVLIFLGLGITGAKIKGDKLGFYNSKILDDFEKRKF